MTTPSAPLRPIAALLGLALGLLAACNPEPTTLLGESLGMAACTDDALALGECHTFRAITGASMGGSAAARIGFQHPELFDVVGVMGTPHADMEQLWSMLTTSHLGGFCPRELLDEKALQDPSSLDTPSAFCGTHDVVPPSYEGGYLPALDADHATPDGRCPAFRSDFNHWYRGPDEGRGTSFDRNFLVQVFSDLLASFGNPLVTEGYAQPGMPADFRASPTGPGNAAACAAPPTLPPVFSAEHNPRGDAPAVAFCDGASLLPDGSATGDYDPADGAAHVWPGPFFLAVDVNGNGRRDYAEPVILNDKERFTDAQPGDAAWNAFSAPAGTRGNGRWDPGEPFLDNGLDGVAGTGDHGEGNGTYDLSPGLAAWRAASPSTRYAAMSATQRARLSVWIDAGIRDFLNVAQTTNRLYAAIQNAGADARFFQGFDALPGMGTEGFSFADMDLSRAALGDVAYLQYGDPSVCPGSDDVLGDGNHVGAEVIDRIYALFNFATGRMPEDDRRAALGGDLADLGGPTGSLADFSFLDSFESEVLGRGVEMGVMLPPDYYVEPDRRYPVVYFLHGQGDSPQLLLGLNFVLMGPMRESLRADRRELWEADMQKAIFVFPDGRCQDECFTGTNFTDFVGEPGDDRRFEQAFYELMRTVEQRYRTLAPRLD